MGVSPAPRSSFAPSSHEQAPWSYDACCALLLRPAALRLVSRSATERSRLRRELLGLSPVAYWDTS